MAHGICIVYLYISTLISIDQQTSLALVLRFFRGFRSVSPLAKGRGSPRTTPMEDVGTLSHGEDRIDEVLAQHRRDVKTAREQARREIHQRDMMGRS